MKTCQLVKLCAFDAKMQKKEKWLNWHLSNTLNELGKNFNTFVISLHFFCLYSVHTHWKFSINVINKKGSSMYSSSQIFLTMVKSEILHHKLVYLTAIKKYFMFGQNWWHNIVIYGSKTILEQCKIILDLDMDKA